MPSLPLGIQAYQRNFAHEPEIKLLNRFFEKNPTDTDADTGLLARPGTDPLITTADVGIPRNFFSAPGLYNGDLFFPIGGQMYRYQPNGNLIPIGGTVFNTGKVSMAFQIGPGYQRLFIADGTLLQFYAGGSKAVSLLTVTGAITNQVIQIGSTYFQWAATVAGPATGTAALPWLCKLGVDTPTSLAPMVNLISFIGVRGVDFSSTLGGQNTDVTATSNTTTMTVTSRSDLASANLLASTVYSGSLMSWGTATLTGGGTHVLQGVQMPNGSAARAVATLASYILVSVVGSGRFYWIQPGNIIINALDFATAESQPDNTLDMLTVGDTVWMLGEGSTEAWYATGDLLVPFQRTQGRVYARGIVDGTAVRIKDQVILTGSDGVVYSVGRGVQRISHHGIEERIRSQLQRELGR